MPISEYFGVKLQRDCLVAKCVADTQRNLKKNCVIITVRLGPLIGNEYMESKMEPG